MRSGRFLSSVGLSTHIRIDLPVFQRPVAKMLDSECEYFSALVYIILTMLVVIIQTVCGRDV